MHQQGYFRILGPIFLAIGVFAGTVDAQGGGPPGGDVRAITIAPGNTGVVYVGTGAGVFRSDDGGATWSAANAGLTYKDYADAGDRVFQSIHDVCGGLDATFGRPESGVQKHQRRSHLDGCQFGLEWNLPPLWQSIQHLNHDLANRVWKFKA
jgi:hypothetical protein